MKKSIMTREMFIKTINEIRNQIRKDVEISQKFGEIFKNAYNANLLPDNDILYKAIIQLLEYEMNDECGWIQYFMYDLDFGDENWRLKVKDAGEEIPLSNPSELYDLLKKDYERCTKSRKR